MNTFISTKKIIISPIEEDNDKKNDIYSYLRKAITAQNRAFNLLLTKTASAILDNKSSKTIEDIYYSYSHQKPDVSLETEKTLYEVLVLAPITEEVIENKIAELKEFLKSKGKSEKSIKTSCDKKEKSYRKFLGKSKEDIQRDIDRLQNYCAYPEDIYNDFANGLSTPSYVMQQVKKYWKTNKNNVIKGEGVRTMSLTNPLILPPNIFYNNNGNLQGITHGYSSDEEFYNNLYGDKKLKVYFSMPYRKGEDKILFQLILGNPYKSHELRCVLENIFIGTYKIRGSSIGFIKNRETGKMTDLCLYLVVEHQQKEHTLDENAVCGVDLGQAVPAVCAVSNNKYDRLYIGSAADFLRQRTKIQDQYKRLKKSLKNTSGGHGRKKKLKALDRFEDYEKNFVSSYNHMVSKRVVDFALKHNAKYINLEYLKGYDTSKFILRNWSYYQLQTYIEQKAAKYGIIVRYINPCYTSQVCSECGHWEENQRKSQADFVCGDGCFSNDKHKKINADFNAARNISKSTLFVDRAEDYEKEDLIKQARAYYGIE